MTTARAAGGDFFPGKAKVLSNHTNLAHPQQRASSYYGPATPSACASIGGRFWYRTVFPHCPPRRSRLAVESVVGLRLGDTCEPETLSLGTRPRREARRGRRRVLVGTGGGRHGRRRSVRGTAILRRRRQRTCGPPQFIHHCRHSTGDRTTACNSQTPHCSG